MSWFRLDGRVALVTGASRGLGFAMAEALAEQGAHVVVNGRDPATLAEAARRLTAAGHAVEPMAFDVTDAAATLAAMARIGAAHGSTSWSTMPACSTGCRSPTGPTRISSG